LNSTGVFTMAKIRPIEKKDYNSWKTLWDAYLKFYNTELSDEITILTWQRFFDDDFPMHCHVADANNFNESGIIGFVTYVFHPSSWSTNGYCYLEDLFVDQDFRKNGTGRVLINNVLKKAKVANVDKVYWQTESKNKTAQALYYKIANKTDFIQFSVELVT
jgi:GNAT superfamily N-acetyltransferase